MLKSVRTLLCSRPRPSAEAALALVRDARRAQVQAIVAAAARLQEIEAVNRAESTCDIGLSTVLAARRVVRAGEPCRGEI